jgi:hypothetical protein
MAFSQDNVPATIQQVKDISKLEEATEHDISSQDNVHVVPATIQLSQIDSSVQVDNLAHSSIYMYTC